MGNRYITTVQLVKALGGSWEQAPATIVAPVAPAVPAAQAESVAPAATPVVIPAAETMMPPAELPEGK
jgi:hypothetical protein